MLHGTFVGADAFGLLREIARVSRKTADSLQRQQKQLLDTITKDAGNFTTAYAQSFADAINVPVPPPGDEGWGARVSCSLDNNNASPLSNSLRHKTPGTEDKTTGSSDADPWLNPTSEGRGLRKIPVRLFNWSSENHHVGRCDGAGRLANELA